MGLASTDHEFTELAALAKSLCQASHVLIFTHANREGGDIEEECSVVRALVGFDLPSLHPHDAMAFQAGRRILPVWISDLQKEDGFSSHPWVTGQPKLRFCAISTWMSSNGDRIGTLCIFNQVPRAFDPDEVQKLQRLSTLGDALIQLDTFRREETVRALKLSQSAKLMTLGKMAASIVHEINNPLSVLQACASLLSVRGRQGILSNEMVFEHSEKMLEIIRRIGKIMNGLSAMAGNQDGEGVKETRLRELIEETLVFAKARFSDSHVDFHYHLPEQEIKLWCRPVQISQVLLNLLNNAIEAVEEAATPEKVIKLTVTDLHHSLEMKVENTGERIPWHISRNIFKPFFTTKASGKGMGLGLSISKEIIEQHGGSLEHDDMAGSTTFRLSVPKHATLSPELGLNLESSPQHPQSLHSGE